MAEQRKVESLLQETLEAVIVALRGGFMLPLPSDQSEQPPAPAPSRTIKSVCVFCGASSGTDGAFDRDARELSAQLAARNISLVYGGGNIGIMGAVADTFLAHGAAVTGVIPQAMARDIAAADPAFRLPGDTLIVPDMHSRKRTFLLRADAFVALPGGLGTLEELLECVTWAQLGIHAKPIVALNTRGYFDPLKDMIASGVRHGFVRPENRDLVVFCDSPADAVRALFAYSATVDSRFTISWDTSDDKLRPSADHGEVI